MARITAHPNILAFLDMLAVSEIGPRLLALSDDGYNVCVGSYPAIPASKGKPAIPANLILFDTYVTHPRRFSRPMNSDAAGRYQLMWRYWEPYKKQLGLKDFSPESQDWIAVQLIRECRAEQMIKTGDLERAVHACRSRWASLPGAGYGQHENPFEALHATYAAHGGTFLPKVNTTRGASA